MRGDGWMIGSRSGDQGLEDHAAPARFEGLLHHLGAVGHRRRGEQERILESDPQKSTERSIGLGHGDSSYRSRYCWMARAAVLPSWHGLDHQGRAADDVAAGEDPLDRGLAPVSGLATISAFASVLTPGYQLGDSSAALLPMASIDDLAVEHPLGALDGFIGLRRPEASGSPSRVRTSLSPFSRPRRSVT